MTQVKNNESKKAKKAVEPQVKQPAGANLRQKFFSLPPKEQQAVTNFFALHNAATWIYDNLTKDAESYVNLCIKLSKEQIKD